ncbi:hypothetical protein pqer_cds_708 [Pandoravirus quercus]|uniref:Uncharacterized protein n=2 Tax=Pandoravirus TaxID=2060084 RepID=A0A2U7U9S7_9VIRU|nr:hypothetical protein pqer_cds_708 [Pandoravirus quercus]AVK75130.1 hypothetical protein pqer_cds_708 [Pandoravirus quercus]QBZ81294.1 hypothetical protein pclt_cds_707 [Pandoravirus celtis]
MTTTSDDDKKQRYGWFSAKCATGRGYFSVYSTPTGGQVIVTSVTSSGDRRGSSHSDLLPVGPVDKYMCRVGGGYCGYGLDALTCAVKSTNMWLESERARTPLLLAPQATAVPTAKMRRQRRRREPTHAPHHTKRPEDRRHANNSRGRAPVNVHCAL